MLRKKGVWLFIFRNKKTKKYVKPRIKKLGIIILTVLVISLILEIRYLPSYAVTIDNEIIGYVNNKDSFNELVNEKILKSTDKGVAFVVLDNISYTFEYENRSLINDNNTLNKLKEKSKNIYKVYEVSNSNDFDSVYFNSEKEAQDFVNELKSDYKNITEDLTITPLYLETVATSESINEAKKTLLAELEEKQKEIEKESRTVNDVYLACLPVTGGRISSRFGSRESIRSHAHKGIDVAATTGTPIVACADGTVTYSSYNDGGYGNLVIIDHGNGVESYYGHCSKLLVSAGQVVKAGDLIAKVGSTGRSTGSHLHFEIRINGSQVNPQKYLYK